MALQRDFEIPGTGVIVKNAYHVITKVNVEKRTNDSVIPEDRSREDGLTAVDRAPGTEINWKAGYIGTIAVTVWKNAEERAKGSRPLGFLGVNPTDNSYGASISDEKSNHICQFFVDMTSTENEVTQAYTHLKATEYYKNAVEV